MISDVRTAKPASNAQRNAIQAINAGRRHHTGHGFLEGFSVEHSGEWAYIQVAEGCDRERIYPIRTYRVSRNGRTIEVLSIGGWVDAHELIVIRPAGYIAP